MKAAKKFATFFDTTIDDAIECHHLTLQLMDEYAKERAIAFAEWCKKNATQDAHNPETWMTIDKRNLTTAELYDIFNNENQQK